MPKKVKPGGDIPYVVPGSVDPEGYEATPKAQKIARRQWAKQNQEYVLQELARGKSLADLGITDEKEGGRAMYRMLGMRGQQGFQDPNYEYDFNSGQKRNIATSDVHGHGWVPIEPREMQEYQAQQQFGTGPDAWIKRLQNDSQNQLRTWAQQNAVKGGGLRQDESGRFYMSGDNGQRLDFDAYGNLIDANTGQVIGDQYGMGTDLIGQAKGYTSPYGTAGAAVNPKYPDQSSATNTPPIHGPTGTPGGVTTGPTVPPVRLPPHPVSTMSAPTNSAWGSGGGVPVSRPQAVKPMNQMGQRPYTNPSNSYSPTGQKPPRRSAYGSQYGVF
jgi:hypothetical protein